MPQTSPFLSSLLLPRHLFVSPSSFPFSLPISTSTFSLPTSTFTLPTLTSTSLSLSASSATSFPPPSLLPFPLCTFSPTPPFLSPYIYFLSSLLLHLLISLLLYFHSSPFSTSSSFLYFSASTFSLSTSSTSFPLSSLPLLPFFTPSPLPFLTPPLSLPPSLSHPYLQFLSSLLLLYLPYSPHLLSLLSSLLPTFTFFIYSSSTSLAISTLSPTSSFSPPFPL